MTAASADASSGAQFYPSRAPASTARRDQSCLIWLLKAFSLLLTSNLWLPNDLAQSSQEREISHVESAFTGKSLREINLAIAGLRPEPVSQTDKALLMRDLPFITATNRVQDRKERDHLYARLESVLKLAHRYGVVDVIVFRDSRPIVYSKPGVVLVLSTELLKILGNDDAALVGIAAHELAHEYVAMEWLRAAESVDLGRIRELELFCDAVAVVVLLDLGLDPSHYGKVVTRIATHSKAASLLNDGTSTHPSVSARLKIITDIFYLFRQTSDSGRHKEP